jgi:cytoskeleton protein RodZ
VSDLSNAAEPGAGPAYEPPPSAGAALAAAREAAGLSIDAVAQQLKLAPRQVQALESDDFAALPGRTFVRGFVRNYARFVGLDPDEVVSLLPGADVAPSLSRPTITPSSRPMGHLPADAPPRRSWTGWVIALVLIAIVAAAGVYEFRRPQGETRHVDKSAPAPAPSAGVTTSGGATTLPNPLGDASNASPASATSPGAPEAATSNAPAATSPPPSAPPAATTTTPAAETTAPAPTGASGNEPQLVLTFKGTSWAQVRDRNGNTLIAQNYAAGTTQSVSGALPLDIVIGNAPQVTATFRGQNLDLGPFVRGTVARLSVK